MTKDTTQPMEEIMPSNEKLRDKILKEARVTYAPYTEEDYKTEHIVELPLHKLMKMIDTHTQVELERAKIDELERLNGLVWNDEGTTDWLLIMNGDRIAELEKGE